MLENSLARCAAPPSFPIPAALFRLAKPGICLAEVMAGIAGMVLAGHGLPEARSAAICLLAIAMAAAGAAMLNCLLEAGPDRHMPRLALRRAALETAGKGLALGVALVLTAGALLVAAIFLNRLTALLLLAALLSYLLLYTLWFKRRSPWGVIPGGIPGALPVLIGSSAVSGEIHPAPMLLFLVMLLWQPPHFWFLALQYREQYQRAGIPVLPLTHGERLTKLFILLYACALIPSSMALWFFGFCSPRFAAAAVLLGSAFLLVCLRSLYRGPSFKTGFTASLGYLTGLLVAIIADAAL